MRKRIPMLAMTKTSLQLAAARRCPGRSGVPVLKASPVSPPQGSFSLSRRATPQFASQSRYSLWQIFPRLSRFAFRAEFLAEDLPGHLLHRSLDYLYSI